MDPVTGNFPVTGYFMFLQELGFWFSFLCFNFILFLPNYLIHRREARFFPFWHIFIKKRGFFTDLNPDVFRLNIDLSLLIILSRMDLLPLPVSLITAFFAFFLIFNTYYYAFRKIYQTHPVFVNDLRLLINAMGILRNEHGNRIYLYMTGLLAGYVSMVCAFYVFLLQFGSIDPPNSFFHISGILMVVFAVAIMRHGHRVQNDTANRFIFLVVRPVVNLILSIRLFFRKMSANENVLRKHRSFSPDLISRPNIFWLFVESYGSILLNNNMLKDSYYKQYQDGMQSLVGNGWNVMSNLSKSVTLIGPSWLAYTSALTGIRVDTQFMYDFLLDEKRFYAYDTFPKVLRKAGYINFNLNTSKFMPGVKVPLRQMEQFFGVDRWLLEGDIPYTGPRYGFVESAPDHYVLNYAVEKILAEVQDPFTLFYLTKNSHSPFISPRDMKKDWREWDNGSGTLIGNQFLQIPKMEDFIHSIRHQMQFLTDLIIRNGRDNDVFILMGDHQPHTLATVDKGMETIVHVISKNEDFTGGFSDYGFCRDLFGDIQPIRHEAMYSILMRELVRCHGRGQPLPDYEPEGIRI